MESYYAKSDILGRGAKGSFCGLFYKNKSKRYKLQIIAAYWQTWAVDILDVDTNSLIDRVMLHQRVEGITPKFEFKDARGYKHCWSYVTSGAEVYKS